MNKNLIYFLVFIFVSASVAIVAYSKYTLRNEEGLVYLSIFEPNEETIEFQNVISLSRPSICGSSEAHFKGLPSDSVNEFIKANREGATPIRLTALEGNVPIVSWEDTKSMHKSGTTFAFQPENKRLLYLSRVGFNKSNTQAVLCIEEYNTDYALNAIGRLFYLHKIKGRWKVIEHRNIWVS